MNKVLTDEIGAKQAAKYNLVNEYYMARQHGCNIIEALEEWDLLDDDFCSKYEGYSVPKKTTKDILMYVWYIIRFPFLHLYLKIRCR